MAMYKDTHIVIRSDVLKKKALQYCETKGFCQEDLAKEVGVSGGTISNILNANHGNPALVRAVCAVVGQDYEKILVNPDKTEKIPTKTKDSLRTDMIIDLLKEQNELLKSLLKIWK